MIPLVDAYLRSLIREKISFLKENPEMIEKIFGTLGSRTSLKSLKKFIVESDIKTIIGYPRQEQSLPCYVILINGEQEEALGLGDNIDDYEEAWDENDIETQYVLDGVDMNASFRIECWSDNGDLTSYLYNILKWCLLSSRRDMLEKGLKLPRLSGSDMEPLFEYLTSFVFRRALLLNVSYENIFIDSETLRGDDSGHFPIGITPEGLRIKQGHYRTETERTGDSNVENKKDR